MARPPMPRPPSATFRGSTLGLGDPTRSNRSNPNNVFQERVVVAMVGLPARGKEEQIYRTGCKFDAALSRVGKPKVQGGPGGP